MIILAAALSYLNSHGQKLLDRARRADVNSNIVSTCVDYAWLSEDEVVFVASDDYRSESGGPGYKLAGYRLSSGAAIDCSRLSRLLNSHFGDPSRLLASADGKHVLWTDANGLHFNTATVAGDSFRQFDKVKPSVLAWAGDNRHVFEYVFQSDAKTPYARIHDIEDPGRPSKWLPPEHFVLESSSIFIDKENAVRSAIAPHFEDEGADHRSGMIFEAQIGHEHEALRSYSVNLPATSYVYEACISSQGEVVAWPMVTTPPRPSALQEWISRLIPQTGSYSERRFELWVCKTDGTHLRLLGTEPVLRQWIDPKDDVATDIKPHRFHWLPSGKALSFVYKGELYVIPTN